MPDRFQNHEVRLDSPLANAEVANYVASDYTFVDVPRGINCSTEGTLRVDMVGGTNIPIYVLAGLNPYRITKIYTTGSTVMTVVGMF